jgi:5-methylcytosine-specific restriction endonuclease McrA
MSPTNDSDSVLTRVRESASDRCGYCLSPQRLVMGTLEVEHLIPRALGGSDEEINLWLSCGLCNRYKGSQIHGIDAANNETVELFNPRAQVWTEHFGWSTDGAYIIGLTSVGRARSRR